MRESRSPPPFNEEPQISKDFWGFLVFLPQIFFFSAGVILHRFSSSDFTDESEGNLAYRITHGFPRIFGRWPMARARNELLLFLSRRFRRWRRFFLIDYLSPTDFTDLHRFLLIDYLVPQISQISQIYTDFFHSLFFSWIYMDFLWFSSFRCHFFFFPVISLFRRF